MKPKFSEMARVLVKFPGDDMPPVDGYVVSSEWQEGRWVYEISFPDPDNPGGSYENWAPEEWLSTID